MGRRILLVEGKDDEHVIRNLCRANNIDIAFAIEKPRGFDDDAGGVDYVLDQVPVRLKESDLERFAVVLDADENAATRWQQIRDRLRQSGYPGIPESPVESGTIVDFESEFGNIRFGVWIMPDNQLPGMLENFLALLVPSEDRMLAYVDQFITSIPPDARLFAENRLAKARIHSYLAVQNAPGKPLGLAITFRYLDASTACVRPFLNWLTDVLVS